MREGLQQLLMVPAVLLTHLAHSLAGLLTHLADFLPEFLACFFTLLNQKVNFSFDFSLAKQYSADQSGESDHQAAEGYQGRNFDSQTIQRIFA